MSPEREPGGLLVASPVPTASTVPNASPMPTASLDRSASPDPAMAGPVRDDPAGLLAYLTYVLVDRLTDVDVAILRTRIADGEIEEAIRVLSAALGGSGVELTPVEARVAYACLAAARADSAGLPRLRVVEAPARGTFRFSPAPQGPAPDLLAAATSVDDWIDGLAGLWFTLRTSDATPAAPVWLCEARVGSDLIEITGEIQHRLAILGEVPPRVEAFTPESPLTAYHRDALAGADLVWVAADLPDLHIARTYDGADPHTGPYFAPDHPRLAGPDRARMLSYLTDADVFLTGAALTDVLDPGSGTVVPMAFRCDGTWIWTEPVIYYLERYGIVPDPQLTLHLLRAAAPPRPCSPLTRARALDAITTPEQT